MKAQKITPPIGYEIDKDKSTFEEIVFKPIDNWVNSWAELEYETIPIKCIPLGNCLVPASFVQDIHLYVALQKLIDLRDHVNDGWQPNWNDIFEKWCIHKCKINISLHANSILYFKNKATAERFLETHRELIESVKYLL